MFTLRSKYTFSFLAFFLTFPIIFYLHNLYKLIFAYNPQKIDNNNLNFSYVIYSSDNKILRKLSRKFDISNNNEEVPINLKNVFITSEDKRFLSHNGIDPKGLSRAIINNLRSGYIKEGGSTITQQVSRLIFLDNEFSFQRKIKEILISLIIDLKFSKNKILKIYLNNLYLGEGAYGINEAASVYFEKLIYELTLSEMALLAGLAPAPSIYNPYKNYELAIKNRDKILLSMFSDGYISKSDLNRALEFEIKLKHPKINDKALVNYILDETIANFKQRNKFELNQHLKIKSSINYFWQKEAQKMTQLIPPQIEIGLVSIESSSGLIRSMLSGKNLDINEFNRVSSAMRPLGSTFKIIPYTAALLEGAELQDKYDDSPKCWENYCPRNFSDKYYGEISLIDSFKTSSNIVPIKISRKLGLKKIIDLANQFGLGYKQQIESFLPAAIGAYSDSLLNITNAYSTINNKGLSIKPSILESIELNNGQILWENEPKTNKIISQVITRKLNKMLKKSVSEGNGIAASIKNEEIYGKTGTSDRNRDLWFIGSTRDKTTGVWIGYDDNRKTELSSGNAARVWKSYTENIMNIKKN